MADLGRDVSGVSAVDKGLRLRKHTGGLNLVSGHEGLLQAFAGII